MTSQELNATPTNECAYANGNKLHLMAVRMLIAWRVVFGTEADIFPLG